MSIQYSRSGPVLILLIISLTLTRCQETETIPLSLKGEVQGTVLSYGAGTELTNHAGVQIFLENDLSNPIATTNENGKFVIEELTTNTYNFVFTKSGFDTVFVQGIPVLGGEAPVFVNTQINMLYAATSIRDFYVAEIIQGRLIAVNVELDTENLTFPEVVAGVRVYLDDTPDVSPEKFIETSAYSSVVKAGTSHVAGLYLFVPFLFSGKTVYLKAYGASGIDFGYYQLDDGVKTYKGLGPATDAIPVNLP